MQIVLKAVCLVLTPPMVLVKLLGVACEAVANSFGELIDHVGDL